MRDAKSIVWLAAVNLIVGSMLGGCVPQVNVPQGRLEETALDPDEAMELRDWDRMSAYYQNPRFIAGPTGFWFRTPEEHIVFNHIYALTETPLFVGQTLFLPVTLIITPPLTPVEYAGETLEPTYHAMPPLPPEPRRDAEPTWVAPMELERRERLEVPEPGEMPPPPYDPAPGERVIPATEPKRGLEGGMPTTMPATAPAAPRSMTAPPAPRAPAARQRTTPRTATPATQPTYVPSAVAPMRIKPATAPATAPADRGLNK